MEINNDKLLKDFFGENKKEIADFGFSQRVMRKLPETTDHSWIVWIFGAIGMVLTFLAGLQIGVIQYLFRLFQIIPQIYIIVGVFGFSVVIGIAVLLNQNRNYRII